MLEGRPVYRETTIDEYNKFVTTKVEVEVPEPERPEPVKYPETTEDKQIRIARDFVASTSNNTLDWAELLASFAAEFGAFGGELDKAIAAMAPSIASSIARKSGAIKVSLKLNGIGDSDYPSPELLQEMMRYVASIHNPITKSSCEFAVCF